MHYCNCCKQPVVSVVQAYFITKGLNKKRLFCVCHPYQMSEMSKWMRIILISWKVSYLNMSWHLKNIIKEYTLFGLLTELSYRKWHPKHSESAAYDLRDSIRQISPCDLQGIWLEATQWILWTWKAVSNF
jgi:hypothetical protein